MIFPFRRAGAAGLLLAGVLTAGAAEPATNAPAAPPYGGYAGIGRYVDPVPHAVITQDYRVCQGLDELTARINSLYRKPLHKTISSNGVMQAETLYFRDIVTGHEIAALTRELAIDISHPDLGRPVWTGDGRRILFCGNRASRLPDGTIRTGAWSGHKYWMAADYTGQQPLYVRALDSTGGVTHALDMPGKFNILDPVDPRCSYYATTDALWRVTLPDGSGEALAERLTAFATPWPKFIQAISGDRKLLIQDSNADRDRSTGKPAYMPEIHLVDLAKQPGQPGFYRHHPFDYGLPEVRDDKSNVVHRADNNYQFHSLTFGHTSDTIHWNYGPMTDVGEPLGWSLDASRDLDGPPVHGTVSDGAGVNPWGQYESHGKGVGNSTLGLYFGGTISLGPRDKLGGWGIWVRDYATTNLPRFILAGPGGHIAGGNCMNPHVWAAFMSANWRSRIKESDGLVWGDPAEGTGSLLGYTCSDVRGSVKVDRKTKIPAWSGMDNNDWRPYHAVPRPLLSPDGTKVWYHSSMLMPYDDYVGIYVVTTRRPAPPRELSLGAPSPSVILRWRPAEASLETRRFHLYRADAPGAAWREIGSLPAAAARDGWCSYTDATAIVGGSYTYAVTAEEWSTLESDETSTTLKVSPGSPGTWTSAPGAPLRDWDRTSPPAVANFRVVREADEPGQFRLTWDRSPAGDLRHYNLYFSAEARPEPVQARRIVSPPADATTYLDWSAPVRASHAGYAITAVDRQGNESLPAFADGIVEPRSAP
jgi:hypothetical protein